MKCNNKEVEKALKYMAERLEKIYSINFEFPEEPKHICTYCKYRHMVQGYDQEWGSYPIIENWCDKDKNLMYSIYSKGNLEHFAKDCEFFEFGEGVLEKYKNEI